ncbi:MAG TPA: AbiV family abortive infection protein [Nitrosopumilaceae archaeon]|nr:AbiV family abortive infection protein [Nitrosopumilaceae archaeon]
MIATSELKKGVELCLNNGKRLLDDAKLLQKNKKFASAIPLYIISYEELNKGLFLEEHLFSKEDISDTEYKEVFTSHSHLKKLKIQYEVKKKTIEEMDDIEFNNYEEMSNKIGSIWWGTNRQTALMSCNNALATLGKLNELKKNFFYVDYASGWKYVQNRFSNKILENMCILLYFMTYESFLTNKLYLESYNKDSSKSITKFRPTLWSDNPTLIELVKTRKAIFTTKSINIISSARNVIDNL